MATVELWEVMALERCQDKTNDGMEEMTLWTATDIAEWLKLHPRYVRDRLAKRHDFPKAYRIGSSLRWKPEDVEKWLEKRKA